MRRPDTILYWINDRLPPRLALGLAAQQVAYLGALLVIPGLFVHGFGADRHVFLDLSSALLLATGAGLLLQALNRWGIGSGYYYPLQATTSVLPVLALANEGSGGLANSFGTAAMVGITQILASFLIVRLRGIFTVEIAGLSVLLIGIGLGQVGLKLIVQAGGTTAPSLAGIGVAALAFATMVILNVWVKAKIRLFAPLIGLIVGGSAAWLLGMGDKLAQLDFDQAPLLHLPSFPVFGWSIDPPALIPAAVTGLALALTSLGTQAVVQRFNDADWARPDLAAMGRGLRAEGVTHLFAALINALPMAASGGAVSLAGASGCASRYLAYWTAGLLIACAFLPKLILLSILLPAPVIGALLLYLSTFTTLTGLQLVGSRMLDNRRVLTIGTGLIVGMTYDPLRAGLDLLSPGAHYVAISSFATGLVAALVMAAILRIGSRKGTRRRFAAASTTLDEVVAFMEQQGRQWGARYEAVRRAESASWQAFEMLTHDGMVDEAAPSIELATNFDEYAFVVIFRYQGRLPILGETAPSAEALIDRAEAELEMAGYLIRKLATSARARKSGRQCELALSFEN